ncbi:2OG-Fe(II) oxygenase family protein [Nocardia sp. NPDC127579]|uniref:2OG-Fe(II) oxygenase family protein n=1 Tax=Nocardia sp. NPDC127579 TaxID=3345402 RepID=UPI00363AB14A
MLEQIRSDGFAYAGLSGDEADRMRMLHSEVDRFFAAGPSVNRRYGNARLSNGYRPPRSSYNNFDPSHADLNDSFLYWNPAAGSRIPHCDEIDPLLSALEGHRRGAVRRIMGALLAELADYHGYPHSLSFENASVLQVNSYADASDRELLQMPHEDGTLATIIWTSGPGLEILTGNEVLPIDLAQDEVLVMPGGILSAMTAHRIQPAYHQVRNHGSESLRRKAIMYFGCPDIDRGPIRCYVTDESSPAVDINEVIRTATDAYGLPADFVVDH